MLKKYPNDKIIINQGKNDTKPSIRHMPNKIECNVNKDQRLSLDCIVSKQTNVLIYDV